VLPETGSVAALSARGPPGLWLAVREPLATGAAGSLRGSSAMRAGGADAFAHAGCDRRAHRIAPLVTSAQEKTMNQTAAIRLLNAATTTGDGPVFNLEFPQLAAAVQAEIAGAPTQAVINVMALLDGGTWDTLAVLDTSQGYVSGDISPVAFPAPIRQIKGNVGTLTGGTNPSVSLYFTARG
jgi:hypothetical protein